MSKQSRFGNKSYYSSVDMIILTDYVMKKLVVLAEDWGKKTGNELCVVHKKKIISRVRALHRRYVVSIAGKVVNWTHDTKDEDSLFELGQWVSYKASELQGFSEPCSPWEEGKTFVREGLRSKKAVCSDELLRATSELGALMVAGHDPLEMSKAHELIMKDLLPQSAGGIILPEDYEGDEA